MRQHAAKVSQKVLETAFQKVLRRVLKRGVCVCLVAIGLWPGSAATDPETPKNSKTQKSDSKVTFGAPAKVTQKLLKSDSKVAKQ